MIDIVPNLETLLTLKKYYCTDDFKAESNNITSLTNLIFGSEYLEDHEIDKNMIELGMSVLNQKYDIGNRKFTQFYE